MTAQPLTDPPKHSSLDKVQAAWISLLVTFVLLIAKLIVGLVTHSLVILSLAAESGIDLASVLITLLAVRVSAIPPDEDHPYGHGKFESLSALGQGILLFGVTLWIVLHAAQHLSGTPRLVIVNGWSFAILILSVGLDAWRARELKNVATEHRSNALEASALHFLTDSLSSLAALAALLAIRYLDWQAADDVGAILVGLFVGYLSARMIVQAANGLTDRILSPESTAKIRSIIEHNTGVERLLRLRVRQAGAVLFVEASIAINRVLPFAATQRIVGDLEHDIIMAFPDADVAIHWRPIRSKFEAPFETVKIVAAEFGVLPHNIEFSKTKTNEIALDYHLEFSPGTSLAEADALSKRVEARLREELPEIGPIFVHLEEERSDLHVPKVEDESGNLLERILLVLKTIQSHPTHDARLFRGDDGVKLVLSVALPRTLSLHDSHAIVTDLEAALRKQFPELTRILIHASPQQT